MTPRWLGPWLTSSGIRRRSAAASGPAMAKAAFSPERLHAFEADVTARAFSAPGMVRYGVKRDPDRMTGA